MNPTAHVSSPSNPLSTWSWAAPAVAVVILVVSLLLPSAWWVWALCFPPLIGAVLAAVHHAEVIAHRVGEPFGTLVLAVAITVIEVALIVSVMLGGDPEKASLPRDTIFATIMIIANGVIGICLLVGGMRHREQIFRTDGVHAAFAVLVALAGLALVLPTFTTSTAGQTYSPSQLTFVAIASLSLWLVFIFGQTVRHRDYFLPAPAMSAVITTDELHHDDTHAPQPTLMQVWLSLGLLVVSLVAVVGLAKSLSPGIEAAVTAAGVPKSVIGIAIALLVLLPETLAAVRAAQADRLQTSLNLALGSALASIGLTIPVVAVASVILKLPLVLGLDAKELVILILTFVIGSLTFASGRTNIMLGAVHLVMFAAFLFLALVP